MLMEEKNVITELQQGKELANRLMQNFKNPSSSKESNKSLIYEILLSYENALSMLNLDKKSVKSHKKKRRILERKKKKTKKAKICIGRKQEGTSLDDGYSWRKYGQKDILGSKNPRGYYRCTHRFTQGCLAVKQVQKSDTNPLCYETKYLGTHTCSNITSSTTKYSKSVSGEERDKGLLKLHESKDTTKHMKSEDLMLSLEDNKEKIFKTFSLSNQEMENLSPTTSDSGITNNELLSVNSPTDDNDHLCFSLLENIIVLSPDLSWM